MSELLTALLGGWANSLGCGELLEVVWEIAEHNKQQCEKLTEVLDGTLWDAWISQVVKGELCEKYPNSAVAWRGALWPLWEVQCYKTDSA